MTLYDAYGREVDTGMLREEQAAPTMAGVRNIFSVMHPSIGLTPERLTGILQQAEFGDPYLYWSWPRRWKKRICTTWRCSARARTRLRSWT